METIAEQDSFKHIPYRLYINDGYIQKLVRPICEGGRKKTLRDLLEETLPEQVFAGKVCTHGMFPPLDTPLQWMSEHLSYPDNFLHLCLVQP